MKYTVGRNNGRSIKINFHSVAKVTRCKQMRGIQTNNFMIRIKKSIIRILMNKTHTRTKPEMGK